MWIEKAKQKLIYYNAQSLMRKRNIIEKNQNNYIIVNGKSCIDFSSNDYLGLIKHPKIMEAFINGVKKNGMGSGASAFISGYSEEHAKTEHLFAKWLGFDKAMLFNSGYCANVGIISALTSRSDILLSDKLCHISLLNGITLSRAKHYRYAHCNVKHLQQLAQSYRPSLIITESIFSMEGGLAPISDLVNIAEYYQAGLLIDDAHGIGVLGKTGGGIVEEYDIYQKKFSCVVLPLGKAFNAMGAIVAGQSDIIETILQFSKTYGYSTAIPSSFCVAIQTALEIIRTELWRRDQLRNNIRFFMRYAAYNNLNLISTDETPIKSILLNNTSKVLAIQKFLLSKGFYVSAIRPPTVNKNKSRLRISLNTLHTENQITLLINNIVEGLKNVKK